MNSKSFFSFQFLCCVALIFGISVSMDLKAAVWYVDADAPAGGDGTSWSEAFRDLQNAVSAASGTWIECLAPPDQIWVKSGVYYLASTVNISKAITIYGGFPNSLVNPTFSNRNPALYASILDGQNARRCVYITKHCTFDGFTIRNGNYPAGGGGGIAIASEPIDCSYMGYLTVRIRRCRIIDNTADSGGGLHDNTSDVLVQDCIFSGNSANSGGAIFHTTSSPTIERCVFTDNASTAVGSQGGGAIGGWSRNSTTGAIVTITNCLFYVNHSESDGGAISYHEVYPTLTHCTFADNSAIHQGGGYYSFLPDAPHIYNSVFWGNSPNQMYLDLDHTYLQVSYCDIQGGYTGLGSHNINDNPDFVGGADYHLTAGSPCIDTANNALGTDNDLDGNPRPLDGNGDTVAISDMGAYEYAFVDLVVTKIFTNPRKPAPGQTFNVDVTVCNQGTADAGSFYLDWYANRTSPPPTFAVGTRYTLVSGLAAGESYTMSNTYVYSAAGLYNMYAQVDTETDVTESNEGNNVLGPQPIRVCYCPADFNLSGHVDLRDFSLFVGAWLAGVGDPEWAADCDISLPPDDVINNLDLNVFADNWLCNEP